MRGTRDVEEGIVYEEGCIAAVVLGCIVDLYGERQNFWRFPA